MCSGATVPRWRGLVQGIGQATSTPATSDVGLEGRDAQPARAGIGLGQLGDAASGRPGIEPADRLPHLERPHADRILVAFAHVRSPPSTADTIAGVCFADVANRWRCRYPAADRPLARRGSRGWPLAATHMVGSWGCPVNVTGRCPSRSGRSDLPCPLEHLAAVGAGFGLGRIGGQQGIFRGARASHGPTVGGGSVMSTGSGSRRPPPTDTKSRLGMRAFTVPVRPGSSKDGRSVCTS